MQGVVAEIRRMGFFAMLRRIGFRWRKDSEKILKNKKNISKFDKIIPSVAQPVGKTAFGCSFVCRKGGNVDYFSIKFLQKGLAEERKTTTFASINYSEAMLPKNQAISPYCVPQQANCPVQSADVLFLWG